MSQVEKKALYEYRKRKPTDEELQMVTRMLAEGKSLRAIGLALDCGYARAKRIANLVEVQNNAIRLRETELIPQQLNQITNGILTMIARMADLMDNQNALERRMSQMNMAIYRRKIENAGLRKKASDLRADRDMLIREFRQRGIPVPDKDDL